MNDPPASAEADRQHLIRFWSWRAWPYLAAGVLFSAVALVVCALTHTPRYKATHLLEANQEFILYKNVMPKLTDLAETERPMIFHSLVLDPVIHDPSLRAAPSFSDPQQAEQNLRANLSVESGGSRQRMMVSYIDTDRKAAAAVCNAVVSSYLRVRADGDQARVNKIQSLLVPEIDHWKQEVERLEERYRELYQMSGDASDAVELQEIQRERYRQLRLEIADVEKEVDVLKAIENLESESSTNQGDEATGPTVSTTAKERVKLETRLSVLRKQLDPLVKQFERMGAVSTKLRFLESELERATDILNQLEDRAAAIRTERRQIVAVRSLASATPPQAPIDDGFLSRTGISMMFALLFPVLIGALRPNRAVRPV
ncbi:MAG: hypothetical protein AAFU85_08770 [Planctomycetota bacterium]